MHQSIRMGESGSYFGSHLSLSRFSETNHFIVTTDASDTGVGGVLSQIQAGAGVELAIAYAGVLFNEAQK